MKKEEQGVLVGSGSFLTDLSEYRRKMRIENEKVWTQRLALISKEPGYVALGLMATFFAGWIGYGAAAGGFLSLGIFMAFAGAIFFLAATEHSGPYRRIRAGWNPSAIVEKLDEACAGGLLSINEIRAIHGRPPVNADEACS